MEHKGVQFEVIQTTHPCGWKWTAFLDAMRIRTGIALTRADAVLDAELAIEKALERQSMRPRFEDTALGPRPNDTSAGGLAWATAAHGKALRRLGK